MIGIGVATASTSLYPLHLYDVDKQRVDDEYAQEAELFLSSLGLYEHTISVELTEVANDREKIYIAIGESCLSQMYEASRTLEEIIAEPFSDNGGCEIKPDELAVVKDELDRLAVRQTDLELYRNSIESDSFNVLKTESVVAQQNGTELPDDAEEVIDQLDEFLRPTFDDGFQHVDGVEVVDKNSADRRLLIVSGVLVAHGLSCILLGSRNQLSKFRKFSAKAGVKVMSGFMHNNKPDETVLCHTDEDLAEIAQLEALYNSPSVEGDDS